MWLVLALMVLAWYDLMARLIISPSGSAFRPLLFSLWLVLWRWTSFTLLGNLPWDALSSHFLLANRGPVVVPFALFVLQTLLLVYEFFLSKFCTLSSWENLFGKSGLLTSEHQDISHSLRCRCPANKLSESKGRSFCLVNVYIFRFTYCPKSPDYNRYHKI